MIYTWEHKIQYYETDQMRIAHHSNYIRWFEEARTFALEQAGFGYGKMEECGVMSPVVGVSAEYKMMSRFPETLLIETRMKLYNGVRMVIIRTLCAFLMGIILNATLPGSSDLSVASYEAGEKLSFWSTLGDWAVSALKLVVMMIAIIYSLNILQRMLREFGIMEKIAKVFRPLMWVFGLPAGTVFLWLVANIIGLGYGAAAMLFELDRGDVTRRDVLLLDTHICISHSNLEDLLLLTACGAVWWIMLLSRWAMSIVLVWELRLEFWIKDTISKK